MRYRESVDGHGILQRLIEIGFALCPACHQPFGAEDLVMLDSDDRGEQVTIQMRCRLCHRHGIGFLEHRMAATASLERDARATVQSVLAAVRCPDEICASGGGSMGIEYCGFDSEVAYAQLTCRRCGVRTIGVVEGSHYLPDTLPVVSPAVLDHAIGIDEAIELQEAIRRLRRLPPELSAR